MIVPTASSRLTGTPYCQTRSIAGIAEATASTTSACSVPMVMAPSDLPNMIVAGECGETMNIFSMPESRSW